MSLKRIAVIDHDKCYPDKCNWLCQRKCPVNRSGSECITQNTIKVKAQIAEELCTGCGICPRICPFGAITIINLDVDFGEPIHSYGVNAFRLHKLPIPQKGKVTGIVGRNGTGKTTAIGILAGNIIPNMGKYENKTENYNALLEKFRGKELYSVFSEIANKKHPVSIKPQMVEKIARTYQGNVKQLLMHVNAEKTPFVVRELGLEKIAERELQHLSGGELQKVALAACALKEAKTYFIDEPSSYLDIRERLRAAGFIRGLVTDERSVLAVEHDLVLLDYLSDNVHMMFGQPSVFGVVSSVHPTREGINQYLEGYAKDENYRFREKPITFLDKSARDIKKQIPLLTWPAFDVKQGTFTLHADAGTIHTNQSIGILGPNGIGKTTFVKTLAGILTPEQGKLPQKIPVAYKPQYVEATPNTTVEEFLHTRMSTASREAKHLLVEPLHLQPLYEKQLDTLSGGELQRVHIAAALGSDASLILLDEPSAMLDVEQRLQVAKTIRNIVDVQEKTVLVVDHDLMFMDYVSDRLLLFEGEPTLNGKVHGPLGMEEGMNGLLKQLGISVRRDQSTKRPRVNKPGSVKDTEQKKAGDYYYTKD
ncbi:MAG: ribosome biogenesis/translation initiation ATPase RLI [Candidatus Diapherotrites archaeon]|uniref:Ribosome biogenesis/translation initiation ATPase RLI n=1 Tax=Candidatus Iainarchaeum sp. TaxID=3101447 RepID=A0A8T4C755_9ARCH|nr:ribosome biogenesis/translation initiation ATPase RLI [Candidatus Diapherotrites archaeon]